MSMTSNFAEGYDLILVRYGELGLKGKNKIRFIRRLTKNIAFALGFLEDAEVYHTWGRIWVKLADSADTGRAMSALSRVFGIYSLSPVKRSGFSLEEICEIACAETRAALKDGGTLKVITRRADKTFPLTSPEISLRVAEYLFGRLPDRFSADMHHPDAEITVEIRPEGVYVYVAVIPGAKGLPAGSSGKAMLLLSGGIDSPVAGWMAAKRGVVIEPVHFHSFPFTSEQSRQKALDLARLLADWCGAPLTFHMVHFTEIQKAIIASCPEDYVITIMRRMMFRITERLAKLSGAVALYTGESVGQVASQTLESMRTIGEVINLPVLRPLCGMDKEEIMRLAAQIGSYDISIRPFEDCCTLFVPKYPQIRPKSGEAERMETRLNTEKLIEEALSLSERITVNPGR